MRNVRVAFGSMAPAGRKPAWIAAVMLLCNGTIAVAQENSVREKRIPKNGAKNDESRFGWPLLVDENFTGGIARWQPTEPSGWKLIDIDGGKAFSRFVKKSTYTPKHRSPLNFAILKDVVVSDCVLEVKVQSTVKEYPHRDVCLLFGYQNPQRFYYTHFASRMDPHANQISS